ncbi:MAG: DNA translocase FtsK 4TM domain-containing protein, partial [Pseudomonadota bacterium]
MVNLSNTSSGGNPILPAALREWLHKSCLRIVGLLTLGAVLAYGVALGSYHPLDPSWNVTSADAVRNLLGFPGAVLADFMIQGLGVVSIYPALIIMGWGGQLLFLRKIPALLWRILLLPCFSIILCFGASLVFDGPDFIVDAGFGGVIGLVLTQSLVLIPSMESWIDYPRMGILAFAIPASMYLWAMRIHDAGQILRMAGRSLYRIGRWGMLSFGVFARGGRVLFTKFGHVIPPMSNCLQEGSHELLVKSRLFSAKYMAAKTQPQEEARPETTSDNHYVDLLAPRSRSLFRLRHKNLLGNYFEHAEFGSSINGHTPQEYDTHSDNNTDVIDLTEQPPRQNIVARACSRVETRLHTKTRQSKRAKESGQMQLQIDQNSYSLPSLGLLSTPSPAQTSKSLSTEALEQNARMLEG